MFIKALTFFLVFLFSISIALANPFIIEVVGNQRVETNTILNQIDTHKLSHSTNTVQEINIAKQQLIVLDLFSNINIFLQQNKIIIEVQENQFITEIKFIGNSKLSDEILNNELILKKKTIFSINKLKQDLKNIQQIYLKTGKFLAHIQPKMVIQEHNKAELIFEIDEGPKANIKNIYFTGNKALVKTI